MLQLNNIHKIFEAGTINENHVLKGLDLQVKKGDFISIIGGNGAGKSTLMNIISGNLTPDLGDIQLNGQDITKAKTTERSKYISRVFQDPKMGTAARLTIEENLSIAHKRGQKRGLDWGVKEHHKEQYIKALEELDLGLEQRLKTDTQFLSGGQRQALTLLMATLVRPEILLLDEHTAALDPKTSEMVMRLTDKLVQKQQLTTIMITHNLEHAIKYGNRLVMLHQGQVAVDIKKDQSKPLTVQKLMDLFQQSSGQELISDDIILG